MLLKGISKRPFKYPTSTSGSLSAATRTECVFAHESLVITETDDVTKRVSVKILRLPEPPQMKPICIPSFREAGKKGKKQDNKQRPSPETRKRVQQQLQQRAVKRQQQGEQQKKSDQHRQQREEIHHRLLDPHDSCLTLTHSLDEPLYSMSLVPDKKQGPSSCNSSMHRTNNDPPSRQNKFGAMLRWISSRVQDAFCHIRKEHRCSPHAEQSWYRHANVSCPTIVNGDPILRPQLMSRRPSPLYLESTITL